MDAEKLFDAAIAIARQIAANAAVKREQQRLRRNEAARLRRARTPPATTEPEPEPYCPTDRERCEQGCTCSTSPHPPCGFCESLTAEELEAYEAGGAYAVAEMRFGARRTKKEEGVRLWSE